MAAVYVCSTEAGAGKTMLAIGLARRLRKSGLSVGYMKAVSLLGEGDQLDRSDAGFARQALGLVDSMEAMAPVRLSTGGVPVMTGSREVDALEQIKSSYREIAQGKDVVIVEGGSYLAEGAALGVAGPEVASALSAKAILVARYRPDDVVGNIENSRQSLGSTLAGVVVNGLPSTQSSFYATKVLPKLNRGNTPLWGCLPQLKGLVAVSVRELVDHLGGEVVCCSDKLDLAIESIMIGTINHEDAVGYFERKANKVVVASGGRPDMLLAALATPTSCLLVVGSADPDPYVLSRAVEVGVPVVRVAGNTVSVVDRLQSLFDNARFHQRTKTEVAERLLAEHVDWTAVFAGLELPRDAA